MSVQKFTILIIFLILSAISINAEIPDSFLSAAGIDPANSSVLVVDLASGDTLVSHNADKPLVPASIMKCVTTASLIDKVGTDFRYLTPVYATGRIRDGVLEGNIVVTGSGDPTINSRHEPHSADFIAEITEAVKKAGIDSIRGDIIVDGSLWDGPAVNPQWATGDLSQSYGTGSHAFNFEDNARGKASVADPAGIFASRLRASLRGKGIPVAGEHLEPKGRRLLGEHRSATVDEIMRSCMMRSDNQFAEALLRTVATADGKPGSFEAGARECMTLWRRDGAPTEGIRIVDGSGLSRANRMTSRFMSHVLQRMSVDPYYASFFPLAGQEGTLRRFLANTPLDSYIALKTGSMNGIQCYAGYKVDDDYAPTHSVVVILNNMNNRQAARKAVSDLLLSLFSPAASEHTDQ